MIAASTIPAEARETIATEVAGISDFTLASSGVAPAAICCLYELPKTLPKTSVTFNPIFVPIPANNP